MNGCNPSNNMTVLKRLFGLSRRLMAHQDIAEQQTLIVDTIAQELHAEANLWLDGALWELPPVQLPSQPVSVPLSSLMQRAIDTRQTVTLPDGGTPDTQVVAIPLLARDQLLGVLQVQRSADDPLSELELGLLDCVSSQIAIVVQASQQLAVERWRAKQLALVREVSVKIASVFDLDELATSVTGLIRHTFDYYYVALYCLDVERGILSLRAGAGPQGLLMDDPSSPLTTIRLGEGMVGLVGQTGTEIVANDVSKEPRYRHVDVLPNTRTEVALPLKIEGRVLGVLDVQSDRPQDLHEIDLLVLRALAESIAVALEHTQMYQDLHRRADEFSVIARVNSAAAAEFDPDILLDKVVELIQQQFAYPLVSLFIVDLAQEQVVHKASSSRDPAQVSTEGLTFSLGDDQDIVPWVASRGETVLENDIGADPRFQVSALRPPDTVAELAVPLVSSGQVIGVLDIQSDRQDAFDMDDYFLFRTVADSVAMAVRNANLYRSERWRRQVADSMREIAGLLSSDMVLEEVLDAILAELDRTLPCELAAICLLEDEILSVSAVRGSLTLSDIGGFPSDANLWIAEALGADRPVIRPANAPIDPLADTQHFPPGYSAIVAPLQAGRQPVGLLYLAHRASSRYGSEAEVIMSAFANYAAVAIENTRIYQASQEQALLSTVMLQLAEATQSLTTLDEVLETIVRFTPLLVSVDRCAIVLWDERETAFIPAAAYGLTTRQQERFKAWRIGLEQIVPFSDLLIAKSPLVIHDVEADERLSNSPLSTLGFESLLALPLLAQGESVGAMLVDYMDEAFAYGTFETVRDERLSIIQAIAYQAAAAIENARLREAQQEEAYVSTALLQVAQTVANLSDIDDILDAIVRITPILVGVDRCVLFLWQASHGTFQPSHAYGLSRESEDTLMNYRYAPEDFGLLDTVLQSNSTTIRACDPLSSEGQTLIPPDFAALMGYLEGEIRTLMGFPLSVKGDVLGVMVLEEAQPSGRSHEKRLELITGITQQAALALQNEQLQQERLGREKLDRELQLAHEIQETFMPNQVPALPGWDLAAVWRAARQVAGDFYDMIELPGGRLGLVIADVADKGMPAALFMTLTRTLIRAAVREGGVDRPKSPSEVMAQVNDLLIPDTRRGMFVTVFYAELSPQDGRFTYANAGHNSPLVLRAASGQLEHLNRGGMALGVVQGAHPEEHSITLEPGDCVVLYTDGITEAISPQGILYGNQRLDTLLQRMEAQTAHGILDEIDAAVRAHMGTAPPSDDLTLIVLRRCCVNADAAA